MDRALGRTEINIRNILFATDFSLGSMHALPYATALARTFHSKLSLAHVVVPDDYPSGFNLQEEAADAACREAEGRMRALLASDAFAGLACDCAITHGDTWIGLSTFLERYNTDLLVMGTVGRTSARKFLLGSVAEEAMRQSPCPVFTVGPMISSTETVRLCNLLYATDFSAESLAALPYALAFAEQCSSHIALLHAIESLTEEPYLNAHMLKLRLRELAQGTDLRVTPETLVEMGSPGDVIVRAAERTEADLVVIGARGAGAIARLSTHFGSIAHRVVTHARCPVLSVRRFP